MDAKKDSFQSSRNVTFSIDLSNTKKTNETPDQTHDSCSKLCNCGVDASPSNPFALDAATPTIVIVASGVGKDEDAAVKQAFANAVQQAVGTIVDAETVVNNDQVIREQILTASNAIITRYDPIGEPLVAAGFVTVRIKATVERRALLERLQKASVFTGTVEGRNLFSQLVTEASREKGQLEIINRIFEGFPANVMKGEPVGEPTALRPRHEGEDPTVRVAIQLGTDVEAYERWRVNAQPFLTRMATKTQELRLDFKGLGFSSMAAMAKWAAEGNMEDTFDYRRTLKVLDDFGAHVPAPALGGSYIGPRLPCVTAPFLSIFEARNNPAGVRLQLDDEAMELVSRLTTRPVIVDVALWDEQKREIAGTRSLASAYHGREHTMFGTAPVRIRDEEDRGFDQQLGLPQKPEPYGNIRYKKSDGIAIIPLAGIYRPPSFNYMALFPAVNWHFELTVPMERVKDIRTIHVKLTCIDWDDWK